MTSDDTIVAVATPLGQGGLGVVRLSGTDAVRIADSVFPAQPKLSEAPSHTLRHGWLRSDAGVVDEAVAAIFRAPHSYTGEDVIEFSCHGSPAVLKEVVALCVERGARPAAAGEFTQRAYLNGKLDLAQAEAVADVIHASSTRARAAASDQLRGVLSSRLGTMRARLITLLAKIEANLDFAEEGTPYVDRGAARAELSEVLSDLDGLLSTSLQGRLYRDGVRVAIVGRPNVGKSSLFNALLARERAIVTPIAGTTRDTLEEMLEWDGYAVRLIDTAGQRDTADEVERIGTERARRAQQTADVTVLVLDASAPLGPDDRALLSALDESSVVVFNKSDRPVGLGEDDRDLASTQAPVFVSAKNGAGLNDLKVAVLKKIPRAAGEVESPLVVTNVRHVAHLKKMRDELKQTLAALAKNESEESVALPLRAALGELGMITGESVTEDVLSSIFRQFCIGK
jgi:tRNA modification GTPase